MGYGWSIHKSDGWRGQLERVHRWQRRVTHSANIGSGDLEDFVFALFQNCYHLREWIEKTAKVPSSELDGLFARTPELRVCRDICNGTKHLTLSRASVDADFSIGREYDPASASGYRLFIIAHGNKDAAANGKYDLLDFRLVASPHGRHLSPNTSLRRFSLNLFASFFTEPRARWKSGLPSEDSALCNELNR